MKRDTAEFRGLVVHNIIQSMRPFVLSDRVEMQITDWIIGCFGTVKGDGPDRVKSTVLSAGSSRENAMEMACSQVTTFRVQSDLSAQDVYATFTVVGASSMTSGVSLGSISEGTSERTPGFHIVIRFPDSEIVIVPVNKDFQIPYVASTSMLENPSMEGVELFIIGRDGGNDDEIEAHRKLVRMLECPVEELLNS